MTELLNPQQGEVVLINAAAGAVGSVAGQLAKLKVRLIELIAKGGYCYVYPLIVTEFQRCGLGKYKLTVIYQEIY